MLQPLFKEIGLETVSVSDGSRMDAGTLFHTGDTHVTVSYT